MSAPYGGALQGHFAGLDHVLLWSESQEWQKPVVPSQHALMTTVLISSSQAPRQAALNPLWPCRSRLHLNSAATPAT